MHTKPLQHSQIHAEPPLSGSLSGVSDRGGDDAENPMISRVLKVWAVFAQAFARHLAYRGECVVWTKSTPSGGPGNVPWAKAGFEYPGERAAHRAVFALVTGEPIPPGHQVVATCGTERCCKPEHLELRSLSDQPAALRPPMHQPPLTAQEFYARLQRPQGDRGCWLWPTVRPADRPFAIRVAHRKARQLSRIAWALAYGPAPLGHAVRQTCGDSRCANPAHLTLERLTP